MQNFITLGQTLLGEKYLTRKEEKYLKQWPPLFRPAAKGSARTPLGPILYFSKLYEFWIVANCVDFIKQVFKWFIFYDVE